MLLKDIKVKQRFRKDFGDIESLKESIKKIGLMHPVVVNEDNVLVAGERRLKALKELGYKEAPVTRINLKDIILGEYDENAVRKNFTNTEAVAIWQAMDSYKWGESPSESDGKYSERRERASEFLGIGVNKLSQIKQVIDHGDPELIEAVDKEDARVDVIYKRLKKAQELKERTKEVNNLTLKNLHNGLAQNELKKIESNSVDVCIIDPPYNINFKSYQGKGTNDFDDRIEMDDFEDIVKEISRVLKPNSHFYCFAGYQTLTDFVEIIKKHFDFRNILIWVKNNFTPTDFRYSYAHQYEMIIFASKGQRNLNNIKVEEFNGTPLNEVKREGLGKSSDVFLFKNLVGKSHSAEKPTDLLRYLIANSSVEGEVILDCFAGSGSTLVASEMMGCNWIGIEKEKEFIDIIKKRIKEVRKDGSKR